MDAIWEYPLPPNATLETLPEVDGAVMIIPGASPAVVPHVTVGLPAVSVAFGILTTAVPTDIAVPVVAVAKVPNAIALLEVNVKLPDEELPAEVKSSVPVPIVKPVPPEAIDLTRARFGIPGPKTRMPTAILSVGSVPTVTSEPPSTVEAAARSTPAAKFTAPLYSPASVPFSTTCCF
jgi:hypothetical protein